jgi:hypothetical protein
VPIANNPIIPTNPKRFGLCTLKAPPLVLLVEVEVEEAEVADPVPLATEALEETWLGYNDPRGLISNTSEIA